MLQALLAAFVIGAPPQYRISSETVPPGGTAQIKIYSDTPQKIATGEITLNLDPAFFGTVSQASVFSAAGDAVAVGNLNDGVLHVTFASRSSGIGQLPDLPVLQVSVPVLATAKLGSQAALTGGATATVTIGGALSVQGVSPAAGLQPAGTFLKLTGTGFSPGTTLELSGAAISNPQFVNAQEFDFTLNQATELTGKRLAVTNQDRSTVQLFLAAWNPASPYLTFSTRNVLAAGFQPGNGPLSRSYGLLNPGSMPVTLTLDNYDIQDPNETTSTIPVNGVLIGRAPGLGQFGDSTVITASAPIRALQWSEQLGQISPAEALGITSPPPAAQFVVAPPAQVEWSPGSSLPYRSESESRSGFGAWLRLRSISWSQFPAALPG